MAEPVPAAATPDPEAAEQIPTNAEDRKAAAALSSLNDNEISQSGTDAGAKLPSAADQEALGKAMSRLEIVASGGAAAKGADTGKRAEAQKKEAEVVKRKTVKVAAEDVTLLVEELDLKKNKATELLQAYEGDAVKAIKAFISPTVAA